MALALPVLLVVGVLIGSQVVGRQADPDPATGPLALGPVPVPAAASADCSRLFSGLPWEINTGDGLLPRRTLADPVPAGTVAWGGEKEASGRAEDQPVVLRCGLASPPELGPTSPLLDVDGVDWLRIPGAGATTWVTTDRAVFAGPAYAPRRHRQRGDPGRLAQRQDHPGEPGHDARRADTDPLTAGHPALTGRRCRARGRSRRAS